MVQASFVKTVQVSKYINLLRVFNNYFLNIERSEDLEEQNESVAMAISISVAYLRIGLGLVNSLCFLYPQSLLIPLQTTKIICSDFSRNSVLK